jgi:hypothetical protein
LLALAAESSWVFSAGFVDIEEKRLEVEDGSDMDYSGD